MRTFRPRDNDPERTQRLVADWHAYNHRIRADLTHSQQMAREKTETLMRLRAMGYSAQEIADHLEVSRQTVYDGLREAGELDQEAKVQDELDGQIRTTLLAYREALQVAHDALGPFATQGVIETPAQIGTMAAAVLEQLHRAEDDYDAALERAGRRAPNRGRPRRFLIQHLDMSVGANGANWTAYHQSIEGAKATANAVFDQDNLSVRQEIQDSKTGQWWFRGGGRSEWSGPTRQYVADFDMDAMLATGNGGT
jgi:predicted DNA-binding protein YlxM (UPF0122 family)